jgi:hypothetical protein
MIGVKDLQGTCLLGHRVSGLADHWPLPGYLATGDGWRAPGPCGRRKELPAVGLSGTAVPVGESPVLASITIATEGQPVVKCGSTVVGQGGRLAGGGRACRRGLSSLAGHGQPLSREHGLLGGRGSLVAAKLAVI